MFYFQLSNLQQQRILVEQLSREAAMQRISVSQAILDIKVIKEKYILEEIMLLKIHKYIQYLKYGKRNIFFTFIAEIHLRQRNR